MYKWVILKSSCFISCPALSPGLHTVQLVHANRQINDLDAVIVTDSTATATPTVTVTPPPTLQTASYEHDSDGNLIKAVVNDIFTYYPEKLQRGSGQQHQHGEEVLHHGQVVSHAKRIPERPQEFPFR